MPVSNNQEKEPKPPRKSIAKELPAEVNGVRILSIDAVAKRIKKPKAWVYMNITATRAVKMMTAGRYTGIFEDSLEAWLATHPIPPKRGRGRPRIIDTPAPTNRKKRSNP